MTSVLKWRVRTHKLPRQSSADAEEAEYGDALEGLCAHVPFLSTVIGLLEPTFDLVQAHPARALLLIAFPGLLYVGQLLHTLIDFAHAIFKALRLHLELTTKLLVVLLPLSYLHE